MKKAFKIIVIVLVALVVLSTCSGIEPEEASNEAPQEEVEEAPEAAPEPEPEPEPAPEPEPEPEPEPDTLSVEEVIGRVDCVDEDYEAPETNTGYCELETGVVIVRTFESEGTREIWSEEAEDGGLMVEWGACDLYATAVGEGDFDSEFAFIDQADTNC